MIVHALHRDRGLLRNLQLIVNDLDQRSANHWPSGVLNFLGSRAITLCPQTRETRESRVTPIIKPLNRLPSTGESTPLSAAMQLLASDMSSYILTCNEFFQCNSKRLTVHHRHTTTDVQGCVTTSELHERLMMSNIDSIAFNTVSYALKELTEAVSEMAHAMRRLQHNSNNDYMSLR